MWTGPQGGEYELFILHVTVLYCVTNSFLIAMSCFVDDMNDLRPLFADPHLCLHVTVMRHVS
jgi:hypothetical protein